MNNKQSKFPGNSIEHKHVKPSLLKMALNLLETVRDVAKAEGRPLISREEQQKRFNICLGCDELWLPERG